jgi:hypothetical protein
VLRTRELRFVLTSLLPQGPAADSFFDSVDADDDDDDWKMPRTPKTEPLFPESKWIAL